MEASKLRFTLENLANEGVVLKKSVMKGKKFINGTRSEEDEDFYRVEVVFPDNEYEKLVVKVPDKGVPKAVIEGKSMPLLFTDFEARIWVSNSGKAMIVAKATSVTVDDTVDF